MAGPPHIRFFAGAPLISSNGGHRFGALHGLRGTVLCTACKLSGWEVVLGQPTCYVHWYQPAHTPAAGSMGGTDAV